MKKTCVAIIIYIWLCCFCGCSSAAQAYTQQTFSAEDPAAVQAACERVVKDFAENKTIEYVKVIAENEQDSALKNYSGDYVYEDDTYTFIVDPLYLYICRINPVSSDAFDKLEIGNQKQYTGEEAEKTAKDIFAKILGKFFVNRSEIDATYPKGGDDYTFTVGEKLDGIPTGNDAGIIITKTGELLSAVFEKGDTEQINRIIKDKDKIIGFESAENIAVNKVQTDPDLKAENISIDETRQNEKGIYKGIPTWDVYIKFSNEHGKFIAEVQVNIFSGSVETVSLAAV